MNKFLSIIVLVAVLYAPSAYAKGIPVVGTIVEAAMSVVDIALAAVAIAVVGAVDVVDGVANALGVGFLTPDWLTEGIKGVVVSVASWESDIANNFLLGTEGNFNNNVPCEFREYDVNRNIPKCDVEGQPPITGGTGGVQPPVIPPVIPPGTFTTTAFANALSTCTGITLSGINAQGHNYAVVRDGQIITQILASETSYTDTGLVPHTNYEYKIRIPYPAESGLETTDSAPIATYTRCLPSCGFGVTSSSVVKYGTTNLRWRCNYNDPVADRGTCNISDSLGTFSKTSDALSGSMAVKVSENNQYTLQCTNVDGTIAIPQSVSTFVPGVKEVKP